MNKTSAFNGPRIVATIVSLSLLGSILVACGAGDLSANLDASGQHDAPVPDGSAAGTDASSISDTNPWTYQTDGTAGCKDGYRWDDDGAHCTDVDECTEQIHGCPDNSTCNNTPGAFQCECHDGWQSDLGACVDIDECLAGTHDCGTAACVNTAGSYTCGPNIKEFFAVNPWWDPTTPKFEGEDMDLVKAANFNMMPTMYSVHMSPTKQLAYAHERGMHVMIPWGGDWNFVRTDAQEVDEDAKAMVDKYAHKPGLFGYWLTDEPHADEFPMLGRATQKLRELDPSHVAYVNLYPNYASSSQRGRSDYDDYVRDFMNTVRPDVFSFGNYALTSSRYFANFETIRKYAVRDDVPFWYVLLSTEHGPYPKLNKDILRWQVFVALAYGAKGVSYYTFWCRQEDDYDNALVNRDGSLDDKYRYAQGINARLLVLGPILARLKSRAVYHSSPPSGTRGASSSGWVTEIAGGPAIVGEFEGASGKYVLVMNRDWTNDRTFTLRVASWVKGVGLVNKHTADVPASPLGLSGGRFSIPLDAGEGQLIKLTP